MRKVKNQTAFNPLRVPRSSAARGFTLIELLVVVAIIALLISILLPSLAGAREQGKRGVCLANLKSIGTGTQMYASEDRAEQLIPIHKMMVTRTSIVHPSWWLWRTANWFVWGGKTPNEPFMVDPGGQVDWLASASGAALQNYWSYTRPLNRFLYANQLSNSLDLDIISREKFDLYRCPSDEGYPDHPLIDDSPRRNAKRSCYNTLGNSYRGSLYAFFPGTGAQYTFAFAIGPWGHRASTMTNSARLILIGEPTFFNMIGLDDGSVNPDPVITMGWHKRKMTDNLLFADGSARSSLASGRQSVTNLTGAQMQQMNVSAGTAQLLSRGPTWQFDLWPTPGARIFGPPYTPEPTRWPYAGYQNNFEAP